MMKDFRSPPRLRRFGDAEACASLRGVAIEELAAMNRENVFDLPVYSRISRLPSGETLRCRRMGALDEVEIRAVGSDRPEAPTPARSAIRPSRDGTFFAIPNCLARYEGLSSLGNVIPDGVLANWSLGLGGDVIVTTATEAGLPEPMGLPEAGITRELGVFVLPGGAASGIVYGREHIPDDAPFSVSCLVRLRQTLEYDYTYDAKDVLNPIRTYLLHSLDGEDFTWECPGSISPLIGFCSPHLHPDWSETVTYPWAPWNENFMKKTEQLSGAKRVETACPDAPLLAGSGYSDATGKAYPHPCGFVLGLQAAGLFLHNGNRLLGARVSNFESQFGYSPAVTDPLEYDLWHHVVMTHDTDGAVRVYLAREDADEASAYPGMQPLCAMDDACVYQASGVNAWTLHNGQTGQAIGAYRMNPVMDVALPRFFHYALSPTQAFLLQMEALTGLFVADDHEMAQAMALGLTPICIE
jgi:hypothetical protein